MLNVYSGDETCVTSTLNFTYDLASENYILLVTSFDQPIYTKTDKIILDESHKSSFKGV